MIERDGALPSLWQATTNNTEDSNLDKQFSPTPEPYDVVVVGGGITGVSIALLLQEAGFRCALLEANSLCFGTTSGTTAHLNTMMDTPYATISKNFGKEAAIMVAEAARDAIDLIQRNCSKYSIDAGFEAQTAYLFSQTDEQSEELEQMRKATIEAGVSMEYTDVLPVSIPIKKTLAVADQAKFHPTRYVLGLAQAFRDLGGIIIENCRVHGSEQVQKVTVQTDLGDLTCTHLIYATHIPPGISLLDTRCAPYRSYALAVTLQGEYPDGLIYDLEDPYHYYRCQVVDGKTYFVAGGEDHKTGHEPDTQARFLRLEEYVRKHFRVDQVKYYWSSQYFEPVDGLPYIGHMPGQPGHRYVATGFGGNGMIYSGVSALLFRDLILHSSGKYAKLFDPGRIKPMAAFSNFVRENADVAWKWMGKLLPAHKLEALAQLAPGEGRVVKVEGETIALYKSEDGELKALAPACTHMGCHVAWNSAEKTWDCPCHGARYTIDGKVVSGPADRDLEQVSIADLMEK
jgi:glycine/D-amino acid oxidase-like deaminating enzyme/nitrite reductase/ring-hydroxylating ferredoxin subunit